jgi:hypothetical protein
MKLDELQLDSGSNSQTKHETSRSTFALLRSALFARPQSYNGRAHKTIYVRFIQLEKW